MCFLTFPACGETSNIDYKASVVGLEAFPDLESPAKNLSQILNPDSDFVLTSEGVLRDYLNDDIQRMLDYLKSYGFYDVKIFPEIETNKEQKYVVTIHVDLGERYTINRIEVFVNDKDFNFDSDLLSAQKDSPIIHEKIVNDKNKISLFLKRNGYAFVKTLDELVEVNHDALFANISYSYKVGTKGTFGAYSITGLTTLEKDYIKKFIQWKSGDIYNIDYTNKTEQLLSDTGLFETVLITPVQSENPAVFNLDIKLTESKHQHVQLNVYGNAAVSSNTADRFEIGAIPKYKHDNIAGANETFEATAVLSNIVQDLNLSLKKPHLGLFETNARVFFSGERRSYEAYSRLGVDGGLGADYKITENISLDAGAIYEKYSLERQTDLKQNSYDFFGFPLSFFIDTRDDKIFSHSGLQIEAKWTPYINSQYSTHHFLVKGNFYLPIVKEYFVLAGWGLWECLSGINFDDSPMDKRIYLGGSQNLRGYSSDSLGNSDQLSKTPKKFIPRGGLSGLAFGLEPRFMVYNPIWAGLFCDVGQISETSNIFNEIKTFANLYWDVGFSLFYFTNFGPIRLDIAYPIAYPTKKESKDTKRGFEFYISFGQAF
jgi:translocation and assembly module TamA